jgi:lysophospholipase L1-like esterase
MGRIVARAVTAAALGISLLVSQAGIALAGESATTAGQAAKQADATTASHGLKLVQATQSGGALVPGFDSQTYGANDDGSYPCTGPGSGVPDGCTPSSIPLPFTVNFFGTNYSSVYLNNNGNLTFGSSLSQYTPQSLNQIAVPMIAPFWSDVDTRVGPEVTFGDGTIGGHIAFGVNWLNVGCYNENASVTDTFQVLLIQRPDRGVNDWDIEFNYGPLTWDSGQASGGDANCLNGTAARAGYTSGAGVSCEIDGSGESSALLSDDPDTGLTNNSFNSSVTGQYVFHVAGSDGTPDGCGNYWALGDSYSSGEGTGLYNLAGDPCDRSTLGWPEYLSAEYPAVPQISPSTYVACSGDTTAQILNGQAGAEPVSQVSQLRTWSKANGEPDLVTATGGGNDSQVDFSGVLKSCVEWGTLWDSNGSHCLNQVLAETQSLKNGGFTAILKSYYTQIVLAAEGKASTAAPSSSDPNVVIVGYPDLFPAPTQANATEADKKCGWLGSGALKILQAFQDGQNELNSVMANAAAQAGVRFVNLGDPLANHELCTATPDILGLSYFNHRHAGHPDAAGQELIANQVANVLGYLAGQGTTGNARHAATRQGSQPKHPGEGRQATNQAATASVIATGRPQRSAAEAASAASVTLSASLPQGGQGAPYDGYLWAAGGTAPYTFSVSGGSLPAGLTLDPTGVITGTPAAAGSTTFTITATDSGNPAQTASASETIDVLADPALAVATTALPRPTVGQEYDATLAAAGGMPDYTWAVTSGSLPAGLTLDGSTGEITGQPTTPGPSTFTVTVTDSSTPTAKTASAAIAVTVVAASAPLSLGSATLPGASVGDTYDQTLTSTGGTGPVAWSVPAGSLPPGLSLDPATGEITGVATQAGTFPFTAGVEDAAGNTATESLSLTIGNGAALSIDTTAVPDGTQGSSYDQVLTAQDGVAPYSWSVTSGSLPGGLSLDSASGEITGTPTASGTFAFTVTDSDSSATTETATQNLTLNIAAGPPPPAMSVGDTVADGIIGDLYNASLIPANGTQPYSYAVTGGALPAGLTLDPNYGTISGTPTTAGTFSASVTVTDSSTPTPQTATDNVTITIAAPGTLAVTTTSLPAGAVGALYAAPVDVTGGTGADTFAVTAGSLPAGLALDPASGIINGTPAATGTSSFTVTATDSATPTADTTTASLSLTIDAATPVSIATSSLPDAQQGVAYSQILAASGGAQPYTWSLASGSLPAGLALNPATGVISGTPTGSGASTFTVKATDSLTPTAQTTTESLTLTVDPAAQLGIATTEVPEATQDDFYSAPIDAGGGTAPYTWSISAGSLPDGLSLDPNAGTISGTPTAGGTFSFSVEATDSSTPTPQTATQALSITVASAGVTLASQSISFTPPASGTVGGTATLSATGGASGNPVVFTVDPTSGTGVCQVSGTNGTTVSYTSGGNCVIDANQPGNASYLAAPQVQGTITVARAAASAALTVSGSPVSYGHETAVAFKITVTSAGGKPTGIVTVAASTAHGSTTLCSSSLSSGAATCAPSSAVLLTPGTYSVTAKYGGSAQYTTATSAAGRIVVSKESTTTKVTTNESSVTYRKEKKLVVTVAVTARYGGAAPAGTVTVTIGRVTICAKKELAKGKATCSLAKNTTLTKGKYSIVATYAGNADYSTSKSAAKSIRVSAVRAASLVVTHDPLLFGTCTPFVDLACR